MEDDNLRYPEELIAHLESDKRSTLLFVLFDLGLLGITINALFSPSKLDLNCFLKAIFTISLLSLCLSAFLLFRWYRILHVERLKVTPVFKSKDSTLIDHLFNIHTEKGLWRTSGWIFNWGWYSLLVGVVGYVVVVLAIVWKVKSNVSSYQASPKRRLGPTSRGLAPLAEGEAWRIR